MTTSTSTLGRRARVISQMTPRVHSHAQGFLCSGPEIGCSRLLIDCGSNPSLAGLPPVGPCGLANSADRTMPAATSFTDGPALGGYPGSIPAAPNRGGGCAVASASRSAIHARQATSGREPERVGYPGPGSRGFESRRVASAPVAQWLERLVFNSIRDNTFAVSALPAAGRSGSVTTMDGVVRVRVPAGGFGRRWCNGSTLKPDLHHTPAALTATRGEQ